MTCKTEHCNREITNKKRQLCRRCYQYWWTTEAPHKPRCKVDDCNRPVFVGKDAIYCSMHKRRSNRSGGNPEGVGRGTPGKARGIRNLEGRYVTKEGYVRIKVPGRVGDSGWMLEHRYVMEQVLRRALLPGENVHHRDGNKENNHSDNLELWITFQPAGQRPEDLVEYAEEILRRYKNATDV